MLNILLFRTGIQSVAKKFPAFREKRAAPKGGSSLCRSFPFSEIAASDSGNYFLFRENSLCMYSRPLSPLPSEKPKPVPPYA